MTSCRSVIKAETGFLPEVQVVDFTSFSDVIAFVKRLEGDPLDIVVANAAVIQLERRLTQDGWEER